MNGSTPGHLNSYIHRILELLKKEDRVFTFTEVQNSLGINIFSNVTLMRALRNNQKIQMDQHSLRFIPLYNIRSKADLLEILKECANNEGIEMSKLADSPIDIRPFVSELVSQGSLIILKDMDGSETAFYNGHVIAPADPGIRSMWHGIKVPSYHHILDELGSAGLKNAEGQLVKKKIIAKKEPKKRSQRRIKITNTHVKGLDLSGLNDEY